MKEKTWRKKHPEEWELVKKEKEKKYKHQYYLKNKDKYQQWAKDWQQKHPQKCRDSSKKYYDSHKKECSIRYAYWRTQNPSWSQQVRQVYGEVCVICKMPFAHVHHIIHKKTYPGLALNINNGIPLCLFHHKEVHGVISY